MIYYKKEQQDGLHYISDIDSIFTFTLGMKKGLFAL